MNATYTPLSKSERITSIDFLRGIAILGILVVNMPLMFQPISKMMIGPETDISTLNFLSISFIKFFFEGKFYVIFSLLFGFGFSIFINKSSDLNNKITSVYIRRLFVLLIFGILHVVFLWAGDILVFYSLFGFVLILFRNSSDKKIKTWAIVLFLIPSVLIFILYSFLYLISSIPEVQQATNEDIQGNMLVLKEFYNNAQFTYQNGTFIEIIKIRLQEYKILLPGVIFFYPVVLSMFLIGFMVEKKKIIQNLQQNIKGLKKLLMWILPVGLIANILFSYSYWNSVPSVPSFWSFIQTSMHTVSGLLIGLSYSILILLALNKIRKSNLLTKSISAVGRMALTNYLTHSIIAVLLFHSFGFGLMGKIEIWQGLIITILIYTAQLVFSYNWLKSYKYGPLEWLWRSITYLKLQKIK